MVFICLFFAIIVTVYADMTWTESFSDYENSLSTYQDSIFYRFSYLGVGGKTYEIGTPELPVKITNLIIRRDEQVDSITIDFIDTTHYGKYLIYPCQDTTDTFDVPDTSIYNSSNLFPDSIVKLAGTTFFDGALSNVHGGHYGFNGGLSHSNGAVAHFTQSLPNLTAQNSLQCHTSAPRSPNLPRGEQVFECSMFNEECRMGL